MRLGYDTIGPNPTDRGKPCCKHHLFTDGQGTLLVNDLTAANVYDGTMLLALIDAISKVRGKVGSPRHRPDSVTATRLNTRTYAKSCFT